ncbi:MAG: aldo/keto reductase [Casimicrobiaceae bacterium]
MTRKSIRWPRLGLGCAALGTPSPALSDAGAIATIEHALARGIRFFDVAPLYGGGLAETRLGRALRGVPRSDYVLCTKTGVTRPFAQSATPPGSTTPRAADRWDYSRAATRASVLRSLDRLGVERFDVVHLHDAENHLDQCLEAHAELVRLRDEGRVDRIGIGSNLVAPIETLLGRAAFDTFLLAGAYTLLDQCGEALITRAAQSGIEVVAGGIFNSGILASWPPSPASTYAYLPASAAVVQRTTQIAEACARHGVPLATAALQFVLAHLAISTVLLGPRTPHELDQNLASATASVPAALFDELETLGLVAHGVPHPAPASLQPAVNA